MSSKGATKNIASQIAGGESKAHVRELRFNNVISRPHMQGQGIPCPCIITRSIPNLLWRGFDFSPHRHKSLEIVKRDWNCEVRAIQFGRVIQ